MYKILFSIALLAHTFLASAEEVVINQHINNEYLKHTAKAREEFPFAEQYSQFGEDIVLKGIFLQLGLRPSEVKYLDLGSAGPISGSNTYIFYKKGAKGVLVEPLLEHCNDIRKIRPNDKLICGAVTDKKTEKAEFYVNNHEALSSLIKDQADSMKKMASTSKNVQTLQVDTFNINEILQENFTNGIDLLSTDIEGYDLKILVAIDYNHFRPKVIITESPTAETFLRSKLYIPIWNNMVNTIYIDKKVLEEISK
jgi:FkbM family methyltransferase